MLAAVKSRYKTAEFIIQDLQRFSSSLILSCLTLRDISLHTALHHSAVGDKVCLLMIRTLFSLYKEHKTGEFIRLSVCMSDGGRTRPSYSQSGFTAAAAVRV
jgi:hypothetical protein